MKDLVPDTFYHYCSANTFAEIMKNRSIWLSDVSKSNDSMELKWLYEKVKNYVHLKTEQYFDQDIKLQEVKKAFDDERSFLDRVNASKASKCWTFCVSEARDKLSQWCLYADDGTGVAIGFRSQPFLPFNDMSNLLLPSKNLSFRKVNYGQKALDTFLNDIIEEDFVCTSYDDLVEKTAALLDTALSECYAYKNDAFSEENEWRLSFQWPEKDLKAGKNPDLVSVLQKQSLFKPNSERNKYDYQISRGKLVSHLELTFYDIRSVISEIIIGPKSNLTPDDVRLFLISLGILKNWEDKTINIQQSSATYR